MKFEITEELAKEILNYLGGRPYIEVFQLIQKIQAMKKIEPVENKGVISGS